MKRSLIALTLTALVASTAFAARITNLDTVPHVVTFERAGSVQEQTVLPNATTTFMRADGIVGLKGAAAATSDLNADGLLKGVIGAPRGSRIPAGPGDEFTIWPGGKLYLQRRIKSFSGGN